MGSNVKLIDTKWGSSALQRCTDLTVIQRRFRAIGENLKTAAEVFHYRKVMDGIMAFFNTMQQFRERDR